jgi:autotransporter-associated beta strand protein
MPCLVCPTTRHHSVVAGGTLKDGSSGNLGFLLGSLASTTVNSGATLDLTNSTFPGIRNLRGAGSVVIGADPFPGAPALAIGADAGTAQEFSGVISGPGSLEIFTVPGGPPNVPGRVILSGENTYGGNTYICDCTELQIGNGGTTGSIPGNVFNAGVLIFNRSNTYVFNGVIADDPSLPGSPGKVIQAGTGTTVLTAANTYTGGTTISAGTLQLGNGGTTGSIVGDVVNNGTFAINRSDDFIFAGLISGSGDFRKLGNGYTMLTADNTFTGVTTIEGGTLQLGHGNNSGMVAGNVVNNGRLIFARADDLTFGGLISGSGEVLQNGINVVTLTANNTYTGGTRIEGGGVLRLGTTNALPVGGPLFVGVVGTFDLANFNQTIGDLSGTGAITLGSGTLTAAGAGTSTFAGGISGTGSLIKANTGTLILSGVNTYTGPTTVNAGSLIVNGSIVSPATVNAGGLLGGTGTLGSTTINGGTLSPGNSIGTVTVAGNLTFVGAGNYLVEVSPAAADRTNVTGTATLTGTVRATFGPGTYVPGTSYTILSAGTRSGTFSAIEQTNLPALRASLEYTATDVLLTIKAFNIAGVSGLSGNQQSVANTIQSAFNTAGTLPTPFFTLASLPNGSLQNALTQASGEIATGAAAAGFQSMDLFLNLMLDPFLETRLADGSLQGRALGFAPEQQTTLPAAMSAYAGLPTKAPPRASFDQRWTVWGAAAGASDSTRAMPLPAAAPSTCAAESSRPASTIASRPTRSWALRSRAARKRSASTRSRPPAAAAPCRAASTARRASATRISPPPPPTAGTMSRPSATWRSPACSTASPPTTARTRSAAGSRAAIGSPQASASASRPTRRCRRSACRRRTTTRSTAPASWRLRSTMRARAGMTRAANSARAPITA